MTEREKDDAAKAEHFARLLMVYGKEYPEDVFQFMLEAIESYSAEAIRLGGLAMLEHEKIFTIAALIDAISSCCYNIEYPRPPS